jgi:glycosyltransferase involved in cell wall biosynthesis
MSLPAVDRAVPKIAILTNIIPPYRVPLYQKIGEKFETFVFVSGKEDNRNVWQGTEAKLPNLKIKQSRGLTVRFLKKDNEKVYDYNYVHINYGYLSDLLAIKPDAVITTEMGFRTLVSLLYGMLHSKPVWVWWGGTLHTERSISSIKKLLRKLIFRWAQRWISYGETSTDYLMSIGVPREHILQIQNCVDEQLYLKSTDLAVNLEPKPVFLYVGQLIYRKGIDKLLEAAARVQQQGYFFSLLLVGSGSEKEAFETLAQELGLQNVHFYPAQAPEVIPAIYRSADYLVFPTLEDVWGLVVNEALWSDVPVLSSVYAGCARELLTKENIFDPLDQDEFANALKRALRNKIVSPDHSRLKTCTEIADMIIENIKEVLRV